MKIELWKIILSAATFLGGLFGVTIKGFNLYNRLDNRILENEQKERELRERQKEMEVRMEKTEQRCDALSEGLGCKIQDTNEKLSEVHSIVKKIEGYLEGLKDSVRLNKDK